MQKDDLPTVVGIVLDKVGDDPAEGVLRCGAGKNLIWLVESHDFGDRAFSFELVEVEVPGPLFGGRRWPIRNILLGHEVVGNGRVIGADISPVGELF